MLAGPLTALKPTEVQLDNLLHPFIERGAGNCVLGQTRAVWTMYADKAEQMRKRTAVDVSSLITTRGQL